MTPNRYPYQPGFVFGSDTSEAAATSIRPQRDAMKARVRRLLAQTEHTDQPGLTSDELERITGWPHQSASARLRELVIDGTAYDSPLRRPTRHGRRAVVRRITPASLNPKGEDPPCPPTLVT